MEKLLKLMWPKNGFILLLMETGLCMLAGGLNVKKTPVLICPNIIAGKTAEGNRSFDYNF